MSVRTGSSWTSHSRLLMFAALWSLSFHSLLAAWPGTGRSKSKDQLDLNVRDWGDYSDLPPGIEQGLGLPEDTEHGPDRGAGEASSNLAPELEFLAEFAGKKRLWVITAQSHTDHYLRMMEKQLEDMEQKLLNCRLAERDTFIVTIIQNAMMEGRIQKTTIQGEATVESLDPDTVTRLLHYLELNNQEQAFTMVVLRKNLLMSERFPYPVRVEAVLELIDQFPMRKLEKMTRNGANQSCIAPKKKVMVKRKKIKRKRVLSPQRQGNVTSVVALPRRPHVDKKAALRNKIQDILSGRSRFVIRKVPTKGKDSVSGGQSPSNGLEKDLSPPSVSRSNQEKTNNSPDPGEGAGKKDHGGETGEDKKEQTVKSDSQEKQGSKKKGKGRKGKKGKGRGKKSNREATEKDKEALKEFLDSFKGTRRLMLISTPSTDATLYVQQRDENEKHHCDLAIRKVTVATIVEGSDAARLTIQHHQLESEAALSDLSETTFDPGLISLLRAELGLSSSDLFSMTITDYDIKPNRVFEAPPSSAALFEYIDDFSSRRSEKEKERRSPPVCSTDQEPAEENSLLRFMSKRRLLIISAPSEDDYSFQQQLTALRGQKCHLGIRHFAMLQLTGTGDKASGTVELFPLNGHSQSEVEPLSRDVVNNMRDQLKISRDYFSMLIVGKDGDVKSWYPSPMWSLDNIYDLVVSMELRLQEETLQRRLGIHCPEERGQGGGEAGHYGDYHEGRAVETYEYQPSEK